MKIPRRTFLRFAGISLALPWLDKFSVARAAITSPRRIVCICAPLGLHPDNFIPQDSGKNYTLSPYLDVLKDYRDDLTVIPVILEDVEVGRQRVVLAAVLWDEVVGMQAERGADADDASRRCYCRTRDGKLVEPRQGERNACEAKE